MLSNYLQKVKSFIEQNKSDIYVATLIFLVSLASFGLGRLSILWPEKEPITMTNVESQALKATVESAEPPPTKKDSLRSSFGVSPSAKEKYVASKNGTAYHYPWCPGALKIKEENKIWFKTKEEAEKAGYKPAGNCEGL